MGSSNIYWDIGFAGCISHTGFLSLDACIWLCLGFVFGHDLCVLNRRAPPIDAPQNRRSEQQKNAKLSKTLFIMITASLVFWIPSIVVYCIHYRCYKCVPLLVFHICNLFRLANSLINPLIYSFRIPMFRETFKRVKLHKQSKKYTIKTNCYVSSLQRYARSHNSNNNLY